MKGRVHGTYARSQDNAFPTTDGLDNVRRAVTLTAGAHEITVSVSGDTSNEPEQVRLNWVTPEERAKNHAAAIEMAKKSHTAIVFLWTRINPVFGLPGDQNKLVDEVAAANPNTIVVLNVSQPIAMPWLSKVKAVVQMWWPGDEGGGATADVLLGRVNPAGRLPFTWASKLTDYPATDPKYPERSAAGVNGKTTFSEGLNIGYRWFDAQNIQPLFPFGFGLSYTTFKYTDLTATSAPDGGLNVSVKILNTGSVAGDEVPQVYLDAWLESRAERCAIRATNARGVHASDARSGRDARRKDVRRGARFGVLVGHGESVGKGDATARPRRRIGARPSPRRQPAITKGRAEGFVQARRLPCPIRRRCACDRLTECALLCPWCIYEGWKQVRDWFCHYCGDASGACLRRLHAKQDLLPHHYGTDHPARVRVARADAGFR